MKEEIKGLTPEERKEVRSRYGYIKATIIDYRLPSASQAMNQFEAEMGFIPNHMQEALVGYILEGRPVGDFLQAVLTNNLMEATARADSWNLTRLHVYAGFLWNHAPRGCWGSLDSYQQWTMDFYRRLHDPEVAKEYE